jgi:polysaccharide biosynthesis transport protein
VGENVESKPFTHLTTLSDYVGVLRRRKWIIIQALVVVPLGAILLSISQDARYSASAEVLLNRENLASTLTGTTDPLLFQDPNRLFATQASIARSSALFEDVATAIGGARSPGQIAGSTSVFPQGDSDILVFAAEDGESDVATRIANAYARAYTVFRAELDTQRFRRARLELRGRIDELEEAGVERSSEVYANLVEKEQELRTLEELQTSNTTVTRLAAGAEKIQPKPRRAAMLAVLLGAALGLVLAFLWEALDKRVRSTDEIQDRLGIPLLGRLAAPSRHLRKHARLTTVEEPSSMDSEAFRMLRTSIEFAMLDEKTRSIIVTSALQSEGKSTTIANLAVAFARAGRKVVLVDLDLRRPFIARFFRLEGRPGITTVARGRVSLDEALTPIALPSAARVDGERENGAAAAIGNGTASVSGVLHVLPAGEIPPDPGEFVATQAVSKIIAELTRRADLVLIDAPPLLPVGDTATLSSAVDSMFVVTRINVIDRTTLAELARRLSTIPARVLGFVLAGGSRSDIYGYGYGYGYAHSQSTRGRRRAPTAVS